MNNEKFNIQSRYLFYLNKVKLKESEMHPTQRIQLKQTFFAACGVMLELLQNDIAEIEDEDKAIECLESMTKQIKNYFNDTKNF